MECKEITNGGCQWKYIPPYSFLEIVALMFASSAYICRCDPRAYKVKDSNEDFDPESRQEYPRSLVGSNGYGSYGGGGFHFPDFFNDGNQDIFGENRFGASPFAPTFPSALESRKSESSRYVHPVGRYKAADNFDRPPPKKIQSRNVPQKIDHRGSKRPITKLYDNWKPDGEGRQNKWSQEHVDDSDEISSPPYHTTKNTQSSKTDYPSNSYRSSGRPYSQASLKQHYKPVKPVGKTYGVNYRPGRSDSRTYHHKYGVNHANDKKKASEPYYDTYDDDVAYKSKSNQKSSQYKKSFNSRSPSYSSNSKRSGKSSFRPSPPDRYLNSKNDFDFFSDSSKVIPHKVKSENTHEQLDESCIKKNKTTTINMSDQAITLNCYECFDQDENSYEQCVETSQIEEDSSSERKRSKRSVNATVGDRIPFVSRGKRQYDDYYDEGERNGGHEEGGDYRFGPEHFSDDYPNSYDDGDFMPDHETETCQKTRKGDMLCISCENKNTGGTYQQCSYASDPKKNSYERSVSKVYGSPRLPDEGRRKQYDVDPKPRKVYSSRAPSDVPGGAGQRRPNGRPRSVPDESHFHGTSGPKKGGSSEVRHKNTQYDDAPPVRSTGRERSAIRTPASTRLKTSQSSPRNSNGGMNYKYPMPPPTPPPSSRAFSTPSPLGPDPFAENIPDPYSPDTAAPMHEDDEDMSRPRNRKNVDASFDPGYDETFASLFPELIDEGDPIALAPPSYDEYPDGDADYDEEDVRRTGDGQGQYSAQTKSKLPPNNKRQPHRSSIAPRSQTKPISSERIKRASCKKVKKNKMACNQCIDEKGSKFEECTYVGKTEPKSKHLTYREVKEMRYDPTSRPRNNSEVNTKGRDKPQYVDVKYTRGKRKFKKYDPEEYDKDVSEKENRRMSNSQRKTEMRSNGRGNSWDKERFNATSELDGRNSQVVDYRTPREVREKREDSENSDEVTNYEIDKATRRNYNPVPTDPPELSENDDIKMSEDGEFSHELELKYDPVSGLTLPRYMLEKSEHETIFDEALASGK